MPEPGKYVPDHIARWRAGDVADPQHLAPPHRGIPYLAMLAEAHRALQPRTYLEVGTQAGPSLALSSCPSIAIDPAFKLPEGFMGERPHVTLFEMTSDEFFARQDVAGLFGAPVDFAFLDGMHRFEFLLRDFMNTERHTAPGSVIVLHDCVPFSSTIVSRYQRQRPRPEFDVQPGAWAGDVWKLLPILRLYRPDLRVTVFDCPPTGLAFISGLDASSRVLDAAYEEILARFMSVDIAEIGVSAFALSLGIENSRQTLADNRFVHQVMGDRPIA